MGTSCMPARNTFCASSVLTNPAEISMRPLARPGNRSEATAMFISRFLAASSPCSARTFSMAARNLSFLRLESICASSSCFCMPVSLVSTSSSLRYLTAPSVSCDWVMPCARPRLTCCLTNPAVPALISSTLMPRFMKYSPSSLRVISPENRAKLRRPSTAEPDSMAKSLLAPPRVCWNAARSTSLSP